MFTAEGERRFLDLNRSERRSLAVAVGLVLLGAAARLAVRPEPAEFAWIPAPHSAGRSPPTLSETRQAVDDELSRRAIAARPLGPEERIDPNAAAPEQLERLPGVGPAKAFAIVEDRRRNGPFSAPEDLRRVPGIGPALLERLIPHVRLPQRGVSGGGATPVDRLVRPVNLNTADKAALQGLPGIGPVRADSILAYRGRHGGFRSLGQLQEVPGIGAAILRGLQGRVTVQ